MFTIVYRLRSSWFFLFLLPWVGVAYNLVHEIFLNFFVRYFSFRISYMNVWEHYHEKTDSTFYCVFLVFSVFWEKYRKSVFWFCSVKVGGETHPCFLVCSCPERMNCAKHRDQIPSLGFKLFGASYVHFFPCFRLCFKKSCFASKHCL